MEMAGKSQAATIGSLFKSPDIQFGVALICVVFMMFIPLPPMLLDVLLSVSITLGFLVLLLHLYQRTLDFSTFPTFLLRLCFVWFQCGHHKKYPVDGASGDVSSVISSFGNFVVGGNYFVGFVIF